jgi:hypothetical protein
MSSLPYITAVAPIVASALALCQAGPPMSS